MIPTLRQSVSRLLGLLRRERPHRPNLSAAAMLNTLRSCGEPGIASLASGTADSAAFRRRVCLHFRERTKPAFFADLSTLERLSGTTRWTADPLNPSTRGASALPSYSAHDVKLAARGCWQDISAGPGDDVLYTVRPHRFGAAPLMALAALRDPCHAVELASAVRGWIGYAARGGAMAYLSNLVVIQRLLALSWAWAFLAARPVVKIDDDFALEFDILNILQADCLYLLPRLGNSFPNNHLLADTFAGWYICAVFPEFASGATKSLPHEARFRSELERQMLADGTGFEHSTHYHEFACEMAVAHALLTSRSGTQEPRSWSRAMLERMLRFQIDLGGTECRPCVIGNATEDPLFPLDAGSGWANGAFREIYRALFDPGLASAAQDDATVERAFWLLGGQLAEPQAPGLRSAAPGFVAYPLGGYFVLGETEPGTRLVFRSAPALGTRIMGGHMHADLLSLTLSVKGRPVVVETGTYTYRLSAQDPQHGCVGWRAYFAGPEAHNGPAISGVDPLLELSDDFRPRQTVTSARTTALQAAGALCWVESVLVGSTPYDGMRRGVMQVLGQYWIVYDEAPPGVPASSLSYRFQLAAGTVIAPALKPTENEPIVIDAGTLRIVCSDTLRPPQVLAGSLQPRGGWLSPEYGDLVAAPQLVFERAVQESQAPVSAFLLQAAGATEAAERIECMALGSHGYGFRIEGSKFTDYVLLVHDSAAAPAEAWGIRFDGVVLWLRITRGGEPLEMCWLSGRSLQFAAAGIDIESPERLDVLHVLPEEDSAAGPAPTPWPPGVKAIWPRPVRPTAIPPDSTNAGVGI